MRLAGLQAPTVREEDGIIPDYASENVFEKPAVGGLGIKSGGLLKQWAFGVHASQLLQLITANERLHVAIGARDSDDAIIACRAYSDSRSN